MTNIITKHIRFILKHKIKTIYGISTITSNILNWNIIGNVALLISKFYIINLQTAKLTNSTHIIHRNHNLTFGKTKNKHTVTETVTIQKKPIKFIYEINQLNKHI